MTITTGSRIGPYEVVAPIGAGGMGEVWRAHDSRIGRDVAIKFLPPGFITSADRLRRFNQEAQAAGSLSHPNLVTIHELGTHNGGPYIVMELLEGETLRDRLDATGTSRIPIRKAVDYSMQIANGLAAAHDKGVVHRDLKPENLFVTRDGRVKILDFGLAKLAAADDPSSSRTLIRDTTPGTVMGTAGYMAPEQVRGQPVDHRADIFSFGAILYEMLSGRRAFQGDSSVETMNAILKEEPPELDGDSLHVSPILDRILRRCLEKEPEQRFHSAHDIAFALEAVSGSTTVSAPLRISAVRGRPLRAVLLAAAAVALAAAAFVAGRVSRPAVTPLEPHFNQLTFDATVLGGAAVAPDGTSFAYVDNAAGNADIYVQRIGGTNPINITKDSPDDDTEPTFSPDGQRIAFRSERDGGGIFIMGATGESVRRLTDSGYDPAWSPDGKSIVFATERVVDPAGRQTNSRLLIVNVDTGERKAIDIAGTLDAVQPSWSPDGKRLAFWGVYEGSQRMIWTVPQGGGTATRVTNDRAMNWSPVWSPDGQYLYYTSNRGGSMNLWRLPIDPSSGRGRGNPEVITAGAEWCAQPSIARDGKTIVFTAHGRESDLYSIPLNVATLTFSGPATPIIPGSRKAFFSSVSPDGQWIAFSTTGGQEDLFVMRKDGTAMRQLTDDVFKDRGPQWSPDGTRLVFYSDRSGTYDIWTIRRDGSGLQRVTRHMDLIQPFWSPDGRQIGAYAFAEKKGVLFDAVPGAQVKRLPVMEGTTGLIPTSWSPDGRYLAGTVWLPDGSSHGVVLYSLAEKRFEKVSDIGFGQAIWINDHLLAFSQDGRFYAFDLATRRTRLIGTLPLAHPLLRFSIAPDGSRVYYRTGATDVAVWMVQFNAR